MKKVLFVIFSLLIIASSAQSQQHGTGLIFDHEGYQKIEKIPEYSSTRFMTALPKFKSLKKYCSTPTNQGQKSSCVGHAIAAAMTTMYAIKNDITDQKTINEMQFSPDYIYSQVMLNNCYSGAVLTKGLDLVKDKGDVFIADFKDTLCSDKPNELHHVMAEKWKVKEYNRIFNYEDSPKRKIYLTKKTLANNKPIIIGAKNYNTFRMLKGSTFDLSKGEPIEEGGHAMLIVGYDEYKRAFLVKNSWGVLWGEGGYCWIKYTDFGKMIFYAYELTLPNITPLNPQAKPIAVQGSFELHHYKKNEQDKYYSYPVSVELKDNLYTIKDPIKLYDYFQLKAKNIPENSYVYVFSVDPNNKSFCHWPKHETFDKERFLGLSETSLVNAKGVEIIIPGEDNVLVKEIEGTDYLCILYSREKIPNELILEKLQIIEKTTGDFRKRFDEAFSDILIPKENIHYNPDQMNCTTLGEQGSAVSIILKVEVTDTP